MAEMRDEHFEVISNNREREYEKQKKTTNIIKTLLNRYSKKQLIFTHYITAIYIF